MKILVTGAKGFIGRNLTETLRTAGHEIFACGTETTELFATCLSYLPRSGRKSD